MIPVLQVRSRYGTTCTVADSLTPRWNRGRISFLVAAFADQIDSDVQEAVLLEDLAGRLLRAFLDAFQQIRCRRSSTLECLAPHGNPAGSGVLVVSPGRRSAVGPPSAIRGSEAIPGAGSGGRYRSDS